MAKYLKGMVGGTGIEPVTPTMSRHSAQSNALKYMLEGASKFAVCSRYAPSYRGQSRPYRGQIPGGAA